MREMEIAENGEFLFLDISSPPQVLHDIPSCLLMFFYVRWRAPYILAHIAQNEVGLTGLIK